MCACMRTCTEGFAVLEVVMEVAVVIGLCLVMSSFFFNVGTGDRTQHIRLVQVLCRWTILAGLAFCFASLNGIHYTGK